MAGGRLYGFIFTAFAMLSACSGEGGAQAQNPQAGPGQATTVAAARPLPQGAHRVKRVEIVDRTGFEKPLVAFTLMAPVDWRTEGGVVWGQTATCGGGGGYTVNYSASAPDGRSGYQIVPAFNWVWNNFSGPTQSGGCAFLPLKGAQHYLDYLASQTRQGARMIDYRPRSDLADAYKQFNSNMPMAGGEQRSWVDAGEALIAYNANGVEMRETIAVIVLMNYARFEGSMGMADMEVISGSAMPGWAMRAPSGQLDFTFSELLRKSIVTAPEWGARIARHNAKISKTNIEGARKRSDIIARTGNEILDMQMDTWRSNNESFNRGSRETSEAIRGVETYNDPYYGGTVELDQTYDNAWQLNDGSYVLTDDAGFEPFRDLGIDGQRLETSQ